MLGYAITNPTYGPDQPNLRVTALKSISFLICNHMSNTILNNRELAIVIWVAIFFIWIIFQSSIRKSFFDVLQAFFVQQIVVAITLMILYITLMVTFLFYIGLWDSSQIKNTIVWTVFVAAIMLLNTSKNVEDPHYFKKAAMDNLKFIIVIEYVINLYVFNLVIELIWLPFSFILYGMLAISERNTEYKQVKNLLNIVLTVLFVGMLGYAIYQIVNDFEKFASYKNLINFILPPIMSTLLLPFIYFTALYSKYENLFIRLGFFIKDPEVLCYAKTKAILSFNVRLKYFDRFSKYMLKHPLDTTDQVLFAIKHIKTNSN
jgi:hypothetical protein